MATKRTSNVSPSVYSFSEDSVSSDEDKVPRRKTLNLKRTHQQSSIRQRNSKVRRLQHISSSCDESVRTNHENYAEEDSNNGHYKKQACNSKNAILARENRLKKKLYLDSLENQIMSLKSENKKMKITLGTQANYVTDLESELSYLRSVLANSKEISLLLKTIHGSGLPVSTSLQNNSTVQRSEFAAKKLPIARKTAWPYEDTYDSNRNERNIPTPPTSLSSTSPAYMGMESPLSPFNIDVTSYFTDDEMPIALNDVELSPFPSLHGIVADQLTLPIEDHLKAIKTENAFLDHSYSSKAFTQPEDTPNNYGVCLHISNKKVSIEFCSKCRTNAMANWEEISP